MSSIGNSSNISSTRNRQQQEYQNLFTQQREESSSSSSSTSAGSSASSSTTTRACARARARENRAAMLHGQYVDCCEYYARAFQRSPAPAVLRELATRIKDGMSADVIRAAIDDTMMAPRPSWAYLAAIFRRCDLENIKTMAEWTQSKERYKAGKNPALNYAQRHYTEDDFDESFFAVNLDDYAEE